MKKIMITLLAILMLMSLIPGVSANQMTELVSPLLSNLVHNAPNTGKMIPERFTPEQNTYLLTVADWVSRITFTPTPMASNAVVTVNGLPVANGQKSQVIQMTDDPQMVQIIVSIYGNNNMVIAQNTYTIYLQRRPSERRTRVSAGFLTNVEVSNGIAKISADLVTINYQDKSNMSNFDNETVYLYKHETSENCLFYYGGKNNPIRATNAQQFLNNYLAHGNNLYTLIYIEDEIVAILPYGADF